MKNEKNTIKSPQSAARTGAPKRDYWDEAKKQLDIYVEECMQENTAKKVIYVAPVEETAV